MKKLSILTVMMALAVAITAQPCSKLFFSEYVEGSSNNKALEIYNPTAGSINLNGYKVVQYNNGGDTVRYTFNLTGSIGANGVYVIANSSSAAYIKAVADTSTGSSVMNFNGNDVLALLNGTDTLDRIGHIGDVANILFGDSSGMDHSYVRQPTVQEGTTDWSVGTAQWIVYPKDTIHLGYHVSTCGTVVDTMVEFSQTAATVSESVGTYTVSLRLNAPMHPTTFSVDVQLAGGTGSAADVNNYTTQTVTFPANQGTANFTITVTDDAIPEPAETLIFKLANPSANLLLNTDSVFTLTIAASDQPTQNVTISQITPLDTTYQPDSLGKSVSFNATVYGINYRAVGLQFFLHDATDGIEVYSASNNFGYTVAEGDSVAVTGTVAFFNGLTQLTLDTVSKIGTHSLLTPTVVQDLDENSESELVRLNNVHLATPSQWDTAGHASGFSCDVTDGNGTWSIRIDEQTDIFKTNMPAPVGNFDVIGMGAQYDNSSPYNSGYELWPRYHQDIILVNGINDVANNRLTVYPNPSNGYFMVNLQQAVEGAELKLFNATGAIVYNAKVSGSNTTINTTGLSSGVYILELKDAGAVTRTKVSVQH